jgi:hypothetical protein
MRGGKETIKGENHPKKFPAAIVERPPLSAVTWVEGKKGDFAMVAHVAFLVLTIWSRPSVKLITPHWRKIQ